MYHLPYSHGWYIRKSRCKVLQCILLHSRCALDSGLIWSLSKRYEPPHDKTNKMTMHPVKTRISLGIRPAWSVYAVRMKKTWVLSYPMSAQQRLWSDWVDAQADLSLHWAHSHFVGFVTSQLISDQKDIWDYQYLFGNNRSAVAV